MLLKCVNLFSNIIFQGTPKFKTKIFHYYFGEHGDYRQVQVT